MAEKLAELVTFPREAVLTIEQLAAALQVGVGKVEEMALPRVQAGTRTIRYVYGVVLDELARRSRA
jgi:hypothetical protein